MAFTFSQNPAKLSGSPYALFLVQRFRIIPDPRDLSQWKVSTLSYEYNVEIAKTKQEVICFHWEGMDSKNPIPHIHIGSGAQARSPLLGPKVHIPSGRVAIEDIVRFLIAEMGVRPLKSQHESIIQRFKDLWMRFKSW